MTKSQSILYWKMEEISTHTWLLLNKSYLRVGLADVATQSFSVKHVFDTCLFSDCLFVHFFFFFCSVCLEALGLPDSLLSSTDSCSARQASWGETQGSIWCQSVWCQQGEAPCLSISTLTSGPSVSSEGQDLDASNETQCTVMHGNSYKSTEAVTRVVTFLWGTENSTYSPPEEVTAGINKLLQQEV